MKVYPNIGFKKEEFKSVPSMYFQVLSEIVLFIYYIADDYWRSIVNKTRLFKEYAKERGFSPFIAKNWYSQEEAILADKVSDITKVYKKN